jgi:hypothetical protein
MWFQWLVLASTLVAALLVAILGWKLGLVVLAGLSAFGALAAMALSKEFLIAFYVAGPFFLPYVIGGFGLGTIAGVLFRRRHFVIASACLLPPVWSLWSTHSGIEDAREVERLATEFVVADRRLQKLVGQPFQAQRATAWVGGSRGTNTLEFWLAPKPLYAIVRVSRNAGNWQFDLACVTTLGMGDRDGFKDPCLQSPVALPEIP